MNRISAILLFSLYLTACAQIGLQHNSTIDCKDTDISQTSVKAPSDFHKAIEHLEPLAQGNGPDAAQANLDLSFLYSHRANSSPDYAKALSSLERYVALSGVQSQPVHVQNRLDLLQKLNDLIASSEKDLELIELMRQDNRTLMLEIQQLKNDIDTLQNENLSMKQLIERLNQLEVQHEQKRKQIK